MRSVKFISEEFPSGVEATGQGLPANAPLTDREILRLTVLFNRYVECGGRGDLISAARYFKSARGQALKRAYSETHRGGRLVSLRTELKLLVGNRCPCCGGARPGQLDHHLPQANYKEFSLFPANLVASCGECNNTKRTTVGGTPETALLHPYFDEIPDVPFMTVTLDLQARYVRATMAFDDQAAIADPLLKTRMKHHFETVRVDAQLESEITELILETGAGIDKADPNPSPAIVSEILTANATAKAEFFGEACWQAAVLRALALDDNYCAGGYRATRKTPVPP